MRILPAVLAMCLSMLPVAGRAQTMPVVLELFTSQGCSSCPPADALLAELAGEPNVIALALHVDYWDYLGWADTFGQPAFTKRQRGYAKRARERMIYTPQMIVQGEDRLVGSDAEAIVARIAAHQAQTPTVTLEIARGEGMLQIALAPVATPVGAADVYVARFIPRHAVSIEGGENSGHEIDYVNIVTDWSTVARWDGTSTLTLSVGLVGSEPVAVIVQRERLGPVLTAAQLQ